MGVGVMKGEGKGETKGKDSPQVPSSTSKLEGTGLDATDATANATTTPTLPTAGADATTQNATATESSSSSNSGSESASTPALADDAAATSQSSDSSWLGCTRLDVCRPPPPPPIPTYDEDMDDTEMAREEEESPSMPVEDDGRQDVHMDHNNDGVPTTPNPAERSSSSSDGSETQSCGPLYITVDPAALQESLEATPPMEASTTKLTTRSMTGSLPAAVVDISLLLSSSNTRTKPTKRKLGTEVDASTRPAANLQITRQVIDLTLDLENETPPEKAKLENTFPPKARLRTDLRPPVLMFPLFQVMCQRTVQLHNGVEDICFLAKFHFVEDTERFLRIVDCVRASTVYGQPLFVAEPSNSVIKVLSRSEFNAMRTQEVQSLFRSQNIVVRDLNPTVSVFDRDALLELARDDQQLSVSDLSIEVRDGDLSSRLRSATIDDILLHANSDGKSLNALDIPMEDSVRPPSSLSSDVWAWKHTVGLKLCKRTDRFPSAAMRWALVSTSGAHSPWHVDCDGLCTMVRVQSGCKWWVIARPKEELHLEAFCDVDTYLNSFDIESANNDRWDLEAILLTPGSTLFMRPNTPHCVFTLESSICHGAHFYATSTIRSSCYGLIHSFLAGNVISNTEHESESRELLRRLVTYYHSVYMNPNYPESLTSHAIDLSSFDGLVDFLVLFNVFHLSNVLYSKTYTRQISVQEHLDFVEGRRLCQSILAWYDRRFCIAPVSERPVIADTGALFFHGQLQALIEYQRRVDVERNRDASGSQEAGLTAERFIREIQATFDNAAELMATALPPQLANHFQSSFGWPNLLTGRIIQRPSMSLTEVRQLPSDGKTLGDRQYELIAQGDLSPPPKSELRERKRPSLITKHAGSSAPVVQTSKGSYRKIRGTMQVTQPRQGSDIDTSRPVHPTKKTRIGVDIDLKLGSLTLEEDVLAQESNIKPDSEPLEMREREGSRSLVMPGYLSFLLQACESPGQLKETLTGLRLKYPLDVVTVSLCGLLNISESEEIGGSNVLREEPHPTTIERVAEGYVDPATKNERSGNRSRSDARDRPLVLTSASSKHAPSLAPQVCNPPEAITTMAPLPTSVPHGNRTSQDQEDNSRGSVRQEQPPQGGNEADSDKVSDEDAESSNSDKGQEHDLGISSPEVRSVLVSRHIDIQLSSDFVFIGRSDSAQPTGPHAGVVNVSTFGKGRYPMTWTMSRLSHSIREPHLYNVSLGHIHLHISEGTKETQAFILIKLTDGQPEWLDVSHLYKVRDQDYDGLDQVRHPVYPEYFFCPRHTGSPFWKLSYAAKKRRMLEERVGQTERTGGMATRRTFAR
ncbi:hypothetical protein NLJ89_g6444 [Agrocybe chaxingu]|uniref:JmjC domain-containing protein n=1 Tax=Agrocybe chaxingu TaxID=84603 RepID=A0A9W8JYA6_9AGAR|nr:hypothetical protein NLJ89_g6444 [Agrocybe chaxingu]